MQRFVVGIIVLCASLASLTGCGANGNSSDYNMENIETLANSPLKGKTLYSLGSSLTAGYGSEGMAFPHYIAQRDQCAVIVEAVAGTTIMDKNKNSYRLEFGSTFDKNANVDMFICQSPPTIHAAPLDARSM